MGEPVQWRRSWTRSPVCGKAPISSLCGFRASLSVSGRGSEGLGGELTPARYSRSIWVHSCIGLPLCAEICHGPVTPGFTL